MENFDPKLYGTRWAANYDEWHAGMLDDDGAVARLSEFAGDGSLLEFGVGTGRLALPLAARGHDVVGVDVSEDMLARLHAKPDSAKVTTVVGDMATVELDRVFSVVYVGSSSIFVLPTQADQVQLFRNAAAHLRPGGRFVLETGALLKSRDSGNSRLGVVRVETDQLVLGAGFVDPVTGLSRGAWVIIEPDGASFYPLHGRNCTHHEMDLMATIAGLELEHRWGDWERGPFTAQSALHVSVYRKPA
ncbi:class I SAM-dependent DNA methyltransferase [Actinokineospora iranica]|uniref:Methyltransferase domain-containing protein n=1 Tax=Actinokineospora iranica TaxID=1271860 RepID=A0A1G6U270_9PSEU|nr:class I SAM-dependent methyltransferase [Actinokineospora iranica]SDD35438.1 Methyltransferase domain-containing protein [Actinokineospora iranica]